MKSVWLYVSHHVTYAFQSESTLESTLELTRVSRETYSTLPPVGSKPWILYWLVKSNKPVIPINKPIYYIFALSCQPLALLIINLLSFWFLSLSYSSENRILEETSYSFRKDSKFFHSNLLITSFDVESLFTNIALTSVKYFSVKYFGNLRKKNTSTIYVRALLENC